MPWTRKNGDMLKSKQIVVVVVGVAFQRVWTPGLTISHGSPTAPADCHPASPSPVSGDNTPPPGATEQDQWFHCCCKSWGKDFTRPWQTSGGKQVCTRTLKAAWLNKLQWKGKIFYFSKITIRTRNGNRLSRITNVLCCSLRQIEMMATSVLWMVSHKLSLSIHAGLSCWKTCWPATD